MLQRVLYSSEDEGWVMSIVYDKDLDKSKLVIIDTQDFDKKAIAEIMLPERVPFGAHGNWMAN